VTTQLLALLNLWPSPVPQIRCAFLYPSPMTVWWRQLNYLQ